MKQRIEDPDLARLFENAFPSTLDTTVKYFDPDINLAFIVTGVNSITRATLTVTDVSCRTSRQ